MRPKIITTSTARPAQQKPSVFTIFGRQTVLEVLNNRPGTTAAESLPNRDFLD
jgi:hypothetical protein